MAQTTADKKSSDWWRWLVAIVVAVIVMVGVWYALTHLTNQGGNASAQTEETAAESQPEGAELPMDDFTRLALEKAKQGDVEGALDAFSVAIAANPDGASIPYYYRGLVYIEDGKVNEAIEDFTKAIELDSHFPQAYAARGTAYLMISRPAKAAEDFNKALQLDPKNATTYVNRARALMGLQMNEEAEADLDKAIELDPKLVAAYFNRGVLRMLNQETEKALEDFNQCIAINPNLPAPYFNRAVAYIELGDKKAAATDLAVYLTISKDEEGKHQARSLLDSLTGTQGNNPPPPTEEVDSSTNGHNQ
jgi:tetratricopeptide (TPR) repeat protein